MDKRSQIDSYAGRRDRAGVRLVQKVAGRAERIAAAAARRARKDAKRAGLSRVIVLQKMPVGDPPGICQDDPDGAYVWGGNPELQGRYQIVVVGALKGAVDDYRAALAAWLDRPVDIVESSPMDRPDPDKYPERQFLSIILQPHAAVDVPPLVPVMINTRRNRKGLS